MKQHYYILLLSLVMASCQKHTDFLNTPPSTASGTLQTVSDYQQLLENTAVMTGTPLLGEVSADNFYLWNDFWQSLDPIERNAYVWAPDIFGGQGQVADWDQPYGQVFYANEAIEGVQKIAVTPANEAVWRSTKGSALFIRAFAFYQLAQVFAPAYDGGTASTDLGIPLRLQSDVTIPSVRASVAASYAQIAEDLVQARSLLPAAVDGEHPNRPSQPAALALLSRLYLSMRDYTKAGQYADSALRLYDSLQDYNTLSTAGYFPFPQVGNPEVLYTNYIVDYTHCLAAIAYPKTVVDSTLYRSYDESDLRKVIFYKINVNGQPNMKGSYADVVFPFTGLATDEVWLTRAECAARAGNTPAALDDLNTLLARRYKAGQFVPVTAVTAADALALVLAERRKELPFRGTRWTDIRRLNKEGYGIVLKRVLAGQTYALQPNSQLYALPIPPDVLTYNRGMLQNER